MPEFRQLGLINFFLEQTALISLSGSSVAEMFRAGNRKRIERALVNIQVISPETVAQRGSPDWDDIKLEHRKAFTRMQSRDGVATEFIMDGVGCNTV